MTGSLHGKSALITGGSRGIGAAIAKRLARDGAKVAINYAKAKDAAETVAAEIRAGGGEAIVVPGDVAAPDGAESIVAATRAAFGRIDILVNNAGVLEVASLAETTRAHLERVFAVNVFGLLATTRAAAPYIPEGAGRIINTSSIASSGVAGIVAYAASKAAVDAITRGLAIELGPRGITVNAVAPGVTDTDMMLRDPDFLERSRSNTPLGRIGAPQDIAGLVAFLASADAAWVTGQVIDASGGLKM